MDLDDLIGPLPAPLGRWMLRRMVASGVRYGHEFVRAARPRRRAGRARGRAARRRRLRPLGRGDLLALLPDTDRAGGARVADRVRETTGAAVGAAHWGGDLAEDLVERAERALAADLAQA